MDVLTVTLNPALDRVIEVDDLQVGNIHRIFDPTKIHISPGGKGINVSIYLDQLGIKSVALGVVGGLTGRMFHMKLKRDHDRITTSFLYVEDETRENMSVVDKKGNTITEFNLPGPEVDEKHLNLFMKKYVALLSRAKICVIGGTVPTGVPLDIYNVMIEEAKRLNVTTIVNVHGEPLTHAVKAKPTIVKPDIRGSKIVMGKSLKTLEDYVDSAKEMLKMGIKMVIYSFEVKNDLVVTPEWTYLFKMKTKLKSENLLGVGDAYIAGLIYGMLNEKDFLESARYGMAAAIADELTKEKDIGGVEGMNNGLKFVGLERIST